MTRTFTPADEKYIRTHYPDASIPTEDIAFAIGKTVRQIGSYASKWKILRGKKQCDAIGLTDEQIITLRRLWRSAEHNVSEIVAETGIVENHIYRAVKALGLGAKTAKNKRHIAACRASYGFAPDTWPEWASVKNKLFYDHDDALPPVNIARAWANGKMFARTAITGGSSMGGNQI